MVKIWVHMIGGRSLGAGGMDLCAGESGGRNLGTCDGW